MGDNFDWTLNRGSTQSVGTGPSKDHSSNSVQGTTAFYITIRLKNDKSTLPFTCG